jgi:hypothetical protein
LFASKSPSAKLTQDWLAHFTFNDLQIIGYNCFFAPFVERLPIKQDHRFSLSSDAAQLLD